MSLGDHSLQISRTMERDPVLNKKQKFKVILSSWEFEASLRYIKPHFKINPATEVESSHKTETGLNSRLEIISNTTKKQKMLVSIALNEMRSKPV